jgi:hypothetical protein
MRRVRWALTAMALASVVLDCISSWRQFGYHLAADASAGRDYFGFVCTSGALKLITLNTGYSEPFVPSSGFRWELPARERNPLSLDFSRDAVGIMIQFPVWPITFALGALSWLAWRAHRNATRAGLCRKCGYNLTGNTSAACPECGTPTSAFVTSK